MRIDLGGIGGSALTDASDRGPGDAADRHSVTYVPARNTVMLSLALGWAEVLGAEQIFIGVNAVDYSGYPDCRPAFIAAFERVANLATKAGVEGTTAFRIVAPLIDLTQGADHPHAASSSASTSRLTVSCYQADDARPRLRSLRRLPAAAGGFRSRGRPGPDALLPVNRGACFGMHARPSNG